VLNTRFCVNQKSIGSLSELKGGVCINPKYKLMIIVGLSFLFHFLYVGFIVFRAEPFFGHSNENVFTMFLKFTGLILAFFLTPLFPFMIFGKWFDSNRYKMSK
jgi:hypothetical protein